MKNREELSIEKQLEYAKSNNYQMKVYLAGFDNIAPEVVEYLVDSNQFWIAFKTVIKNNELPEETLDKAAKKVKSESFLVAIAYHLNTSAKTLEYLAKMRDRDVLAAVGANPNTPKELLDQMSDVDDFYIQRAIFLNPNAKKETKQKIRAKNKKFAFLFAKSWYDTQKIMINASGN